MAYVARIKPYDPRKGQVGRSYAHRGLDRRFEEGRIYRDLTEAEAEALRAIRQPKAGRGPLFDVGTPEEMEQVLANEAAAKLGVSRAVAPLVVPPPLLAAPAPPVAPIAIPIKQLEHTDFPATRQRIQHTQGAPVTQATPSSTAPPKGAPPKGPRRPGGNRK